MDFANGWVQLLRIKFCIFVAEFNLNLNKNEPSNILR